MDPFAMRLILAAALMALSSEVEAGTLIYIGEARKPAGLEVCPAGFDLVVNLNSGVRVPWNVWCYSRVPAPVRKPQERRKKDLRKPDGARLVLTGFEVRDYSLLAKPEVASYCVGTFGFTPKIS